MFNHHYEKVGQTYWQFSDKDEAFNVKAQRQIDKNDAICENYGQKPNYRFLFYYGFLIENNKKNAVYIKLHLNKGDEREKLKATLLGNTPGYYIKTFKYFEDFKDNFAKNNKLMGYLRFIQYNGDLTKIANDCLIPPVKSINTATSMRRKLRLAAISVANEVDALKKLKEIAEICLNKYPQKYEEDLKLLENKTLTFNERNCIIYRLGEKKIYKDMIEMATISIKMLSMKYEEANKYYAGLNRDLPYAAYMDKVILPLLNSSA